MKPHDVEQPGEQRIEIVLAALRHAEPAPGMQGRLAAALQREVADAPAPSRWWRMPQLAGAAGFLTAGVLLLVFVSHHRAGMPKGAASFASKSRVQPRIAPNHSFEIATDASSASGGEHASATHHAMPLAHREAQASGNATASASPQPESAQAQQSFPAPPLPLTEQERLLIRLVHKDDPVQLAQLTPAARETALQRDREQVREFFRPPPMPAANFKLEPYPVLGGTQ